MSIEINTSGFYKGANEQFTSDLIIKEAILRKIPLTLGSDAHRPEDVGYHFAEMLSTLKKFGLMEITQWDQQAQVKIKI